MMQEDIEKWAKAFLDFHPNAVAADTWSNKGMGSYG